MARRFQFARSVTVFLCRGAAGAAAQGVALAATRIFRAIGPQHLYLQPSLER